MKQIALTIQPLSPLSIGRQKPGGVVSEAENYIPGSVLRGALAARLLQGKPQEQRSNLRGGGTDFSRLFLDEYAAIFQNCYPLKSEVSTNGSGKHKLVDSVIWVVPATAISAKTDPGFKSEKEPDKFGVFDTLIDRYCAEVHDHPYDPLPETEGDRLEPLSGFYTKGKPYYESHSAPKRLLTRVGINRRRATAEEQILYSLEVLSETNAKGNPSRFVGNILVRDDDLAAKLLEALKNGRLADMRLGGGASRGLGQVAITAEFSKVPNGISERIHQFNTALQNRWKLWDIFKTVSFPNDRTFFSLTLQSEAILTEQWQRTFVISEDMLREATGIEDSTLKLEVAYASSGLRSGWNSAWGLMKDTELITNMGAVYLFSVDSKRENDWMDALQHLEHRGIGERTCEGFGQIRICDEFHLLFREGRK
jgi:CRISPR-associated protein Csx10